MKPIEAVKKQICPEFHEKPRDWWRDFYIEKHLDKMKGMNEKEKREYIASELDLKKQFVKSNRSELELKALMSIGYVLLKGEEEEEDLTIE